MPEQIKKNTSGKSSAEAAAPKQQLSAEQPQSGAGETTSRQTGQSSNQMSGMKEGNGDGVMQHVRSTANEAYGSATSKAAEKLEEQKATLSGGLSSVASNIRKFGETVETAEENDQISRLAAEYSQIAANKLEQAVSYFDHKDVNAVYRDFEDLARRYPAWFVGGAFAVGFLVARFLKSSNERSYSSSSGSYRPHMSDQGIRLGSEMRAG